MAEKNPHVDLANKYATDVVRGKIPACLYVLQACKRHLKDKDLEKSKKDSFPYKFDKKKAESICKFAELMPHVKGKWAGSTIKLQPWQCFLLCVVFGWVRKSDGLRRFREIYAEIPRKNSKSTIGAIIGNFMFAVDGVSIVDCDAGIPWQKTITTTDAWADIVFNYSNPISGLQITAEILP